MMLITYQQFAQLTLTGSKDQTQGGNSSSRFWVGKPFFYEGGDNHLLESVRERAFNERIICQLGNRRQGDGRQFLRRNVGISVQ